MAQMDSLLKGLDEEVNDVDEGQSCIAIPNCVKYSRSDG